MIRTSFLKTKQMNPRGLRNLRNKGIITWIIVVFPNSSFLILITFFLRLHYPEIFFKTETKACGWAWNNKEMEWTQRTLLSQQWSLGWRCGYAPLPQYSLNSHFVPKTSLITFISIVIAKLYEIAKRNIPVYKKLCNAAFWK